jgi:hypothetical protein
MHRGLSCGIHFRTGLDDIAHNDGFHLVRANAGARNCGTDRRRAKIWSRYVFESAAEGADRCAHWFGKHD